MSRASQERLNQIASARLTELGVEPNVGGDGKVHGQLPLAGVKNPFTQQEIASAAFVVESHDWLRFTSPALLAGLAPIQYYGLAEWAPLVAHVQELLDYRKSAVDRLATHLAHFRVEARIDGQHGAVVAAVPLAGKGSVVLIGDEKGVRASHLRPEDGGENQPLPSVPIELAEFADAADLTRFLDNLAGRARQIPVGFEAPRTGEYRPDPRPDSGFGAAPKTDDTSRLPMPTPKPTPATAAEGVRDPATATPATATPADPDEDAVREDTSEISSDDDWMPSTNAFSLRTATPNQPGAVPSTAVTAGMVFRCFGDNAQLSQGVSIMRTWYVGEQRIKLTLRQKRGRLFAGRVSGPDGATLWSGELEVDKHPPMDELVFHLLKARGFDVKQLSSAPPAAGRVSAPASDLAPEARAEAPAPVDVPSSPPATEGLPVPGEVWLMNVVVEQATQDEVRYSALNAEGQPYGAARILPRANFDEVFSEHGGSWRLLVRVLASSPQQIAYVQLDPSHQPNGETRSIAPAIFLANFVPDPATS